MFSSGRTATSRNTALWFAGATAAAAASYTFAAPAADWAQIRKEVVDVLDNNDWDDGSYGPVLVRLAWHAAGTYCTFSQTGGSEGATMRFNPEAGHGANAGLEKARAFLEPIKKAHPEISYADLWAFAACVAIEEMGGPQIAFRAGRSDDKGNAKCTPDGRLPDAARGEDHLRAIFYRMGFNDREIVALSGAHAMGRCHTDRSGFEGPWTNAPTTFSNEYFVQLLEKTWQVRQWDGPMQYEDKETKSLMMLPTDIALTKDADFMTYVQLYAKDEEQFMQDFASAFGKLIELGVPAFGNNTCPVTHVKGPGGAAAPAAAAGGAAKKKGWW